MKANETKSTHVTFTTRRATCPPVHIHGVNFLNQMTSNISASTSTDD
jgi:hypothetical protein